MIKLKKTQKKFIIFIFTIIFFAFFCLTDFLINHKKDILKDISFSGAYEDRDGILLQVYLTEDEKFRIYKSVTEYPSDFIEALLLQEDKKFFSHHGLNPISVLRAGFETYIKKSRRFGASTVTMQTAKLQKKLYTKNISGKLKQIFFALRLEFLYSKQDILNAYVNLAPCGKNIEGFEAASQYFFSKSIKDLDLSEKLLLCVLPQNPNARCPSKNNIPVALLNARKHLFEEWKKNHPEDKVFDSIMELPVQLTCSFPEKAPHFTRLFELSTSLKNKTTRGITKTSLSVPLQNLVQRRITDFVRQNKNRGITNASALLIDYKKMQVLAEIGSASFYNDEISGQIDANISKRSPGSTLKPFIYALSLDQGLIHFSTMLKDVPSAFSEYTPDNYGNTFKGPMKAWQALTESRNIPAVFLAKNLSNPDLYDFLLKAGISDLKEKDSYGLSLVLGSAEITPFELAKLYCALANGGILKEISTFKEKTGKPEEKKLFSEEAAFIVRKMLEKNPSPVEIRPKEAQKIPCGFKTGTSIAFRDSWTAGFFGQYVLVVWIGNFDGSGNSSFLGRTAAAPLFFSIADSLIADGRCSLPKEKVPKKARLVDVCNVSGSIPNENCPHTEKTWFILGVSPIEKCKIHRKILIDTRTGYRTDDEYSKYTKSVVREFWPSDLMALFNQAGLPRLSPPEYPRESDWKNTALGFPPQIISPLAYTEYVFRRSTPERNVIILNASCDADGGELFWFCDSTFVCRSQPGEKKIWQAPLGLHELTVTDKKGRSASMKLTVTETE